MDHVYVLVPAQDYVGNFLMTFKDYPQRQKAASFNLDEVLAKLKQGGSEPGQALHPTGSPTGKPGKPE
jgi:arylsulfatase